MQLDSHAEGARLGIIIHASSDFEAFLKLLPSLIASHYIALLLSLPYRAHHNSGLNQKRLCNALQDMLSLLWLYSTCKIADAPQKLSQGPRSSPAAAVPACNN